MSDKERQWLESIERAMTTLGFRLIDAERGPMDSGTADFTDDDITVGIIRDRSQWMLKGERKDLEPLGLSRAYDSASEFVEALKRYVRHIKC